jgi:hypothetical protein
MRQAATSDAAMARRGRRQRRRNRPDRAKDFDATTCTSARREVPFPGAGFYFLGLRCSSIVGGKTLRFPPNTPLFTAKFRRNGLNKTVIRVL